MYLYHRYVLDVSTNKRHIANVSLIKSDEIRIINKNRRFDFNWNKEKEFLVYQLTIDEEDEPIGLLSLSNRPDDMAIEIRLIASSKENIGKNRGYDRIAGCLIAFACREAFRFGYDGFVCLKPKTQLAPYYSSKYGFESAKLYLVTEGDNSLKLIKEYYD